MYDAIREGGPYQMEVWPDPGEHYTVDDRQSWAMTGRRGPQPAGPGPDPRARPAPAPHPRAAVGVRDVRMAAARSRLRERAEEAAWVGLLVVLAPVAIVATAVCAWVELKAIDELGIE